MHASTPTSESASIGAPRLRYGALEIGHADVTPPPSDFAHQGASAAGGEAIDNMGIYVRDVATWLGQQPEKSSSG